MKAQIFGLVGLELLAMASNNSDFLAKFASMNLYTPSGKIEHRSQFLPNVGSRYEGHFDRYERFNDRNTEYLADRNKRWHNCKRTKRIPAGGGLL